MCVQFTDICHSRITFPLHNVRIPVRVLHRHRLGVHVFRAGRLAVLHALTVARETIDLEVLPEEGERMGRDSEQTQGQPAELRGVFTGDTFPPELVH